MFRSIKKLKGNIIANIIILSLVFLIVLSLFLEFVLMRKHLPFNVQIERGKWIEIIINYFASLLGGVISIVGIWWQIDKTSKDNLEEKKEKIREYCRFIINKNLHDSKFFEKIKFKQILLSYNCTMIHNSNSEPDVYEFDLNYINNNIDNLMLLGNNIFEDIIDISNDIARYNKNILNLMKSCSSKKKLLRDLKKELNTMKLEKEELNRINDVIGLIFDISDIMYYYFDENVLERATYKKMNQLLLDLQEKKVDNICLLNLLNHLEIMKSESDDIYIKLQNHAELFNKFLEFMNIELNTILVDMIHNGFFTEDRQKLIVQPLLEACLQDKNCNGEGLRIYNELEVLIKKLQ